MKTPQTDFSQGSVRLAILRLALPMTVAQMVQVLYNIVDRIYIGHLPGASSLALTGMGLTFPVVTLVAAFTNLFGAGGAPLCSIARGRHEDDRAEKIMGNTFFMLAVTSLVLTAFCYLTLKPMLFLFGASPETYPYARDYLLIYLLGTPFTMAATGMNGFINAQGFGRVGMATILLGAGLNLILDPIFIFGLGLGIRGAAVATVLSQMLGAWWVVRFLTGRRTLLRLKPALFRPDIPLLKEITGLGLSGFIMQATNGLVIVACNATLQSFGGALYVGIMTVMNSVRDVIMLPVLGLTNAAQPVLGYNYGAKLGRRVRQAVNFTFVSCLVYTAAAWVCILLFPAFLLGIFNPDPALITHGVPAMHLYFFGFVMMTFQFSGQSTFIGLGQAKQAIFFSIYRKAIFVVPLTLVLPHVAGLGVNGVFVAEPISNLVGGLASFITMRFALRQLCPKEPAPAAEG